MQNYDHSIYILLDLEYKKLLHDETNLLEIIMSRAELHCYNDEFKVSIDD